jgi:hypothetical protein
MLKEAYTSGKEDGRHHQSVDESLVMDDANEYAISAIMSDPRYERFVDDEDAFLVVDGTLTGVMDKIVEAYLAGRNGEDYPITKKEVQDYIESGVARIEAEEEQKVAKYWNDRYLPYDDGR